MELHCVCFRVYHCVQCMVISTAPPQNFGNRSSCLVLGSCLCPLVQTSNRQCHFLQRRKTCWKMLTPNPMEWCFIKFDRGVKSYSRFGTVRDLISYATVSPPNLKSCGPLESLWTWYRRKISQRASAANRYPAISTMCDLLAELFKRYAVLYM